MITIKMTIAFNLYKRTMFVVACQHQNVNVHGMFSACRLSRLYQTKLSGLGPQAATQLSVYKHQHVIREHVM